MLNPYLDTQGTMFDLLNEERVELDDTIELNAYQIMWLEYNELS